MSRQALTARGLARAAAFVGVFAGLALAFVPASTESSASDALDDPAVLPGEDAVVLYTGWSHGVGEPNGKYVFRYTVHGTLNGTPIDVTASSRPIFLTD